MIVGITKAVFSVFNAIDGASWLNNYEIAKILHEIAIFEEMKGEKFKPRAYEKAALYIGSLSDDLATIYKKKKGLVHWWNYQE